MSTEPFLGLFCASTIAFLFGLVSCFAGYRFFIVLLPIWGFFFGLLFGAQTMQALFGEGFLATVTSWVVGFVAGTVFALFSYLFYIVAVAFIAGSLGYSLAVGLLLAIGLPIGFIVWLVGIVAAVVLAVVVLRFNVQKWVIILATALLGAGVIYGAFILLFNPVAGVLANPVQVALRQSPLLTILFILLATAGAFVQYRMGRTTTIVEYNRWETTADAAP